MKIKQTTRDKFWKKVNKTDTCWLWTSQLRNGYGMFTINYKPLSAHRVSWELHNGPIPKGLLVCHKCDIPSCVNPEHLFLGTIQDNTNDRDSKGRFKVLNGELNGSAILTEKDVLDIRSRERYNGFQTKLAEEYGVSNSTISAILHRRIWKHI